MFAAATRSSGGVARILQIPPVSCNSPASRPKGANVGGETMIRAVLASALFLATAMVPAAADDPVGSYDVSGTDPSNRGTYSGTASIEKTGETYRVVWQIGSDRYVGTGVGNDQFIAVSYRFGNESGLALYSSSGRGWKGVWTYSGGRQLGTEIWTRR